MHTGLLILRWIGAVIAAFVAYLIAFVLGVLVAKQFGTISDWIIACATIAAALAGAMVVPREQRRTAVLALSLLATLYPLWIFVSASSAGRFNAGSFSALLYTLSGGFLAWYSSRHFDRIRSDRPATR
jgi:hypothetical protein